MDRRRVEKLTKDKERKKDEERIELETGSWKRCIEEDRRMSLDEIKGEAKMGDMYRCSVCVCEWSEE